MFRAGAAARLLVGLAYYVLLTLATTQAAERHATIVIDGAIGTTLFAEHADEPRYPASLTKMMTLYVLFEELEAGRFALNDQFSVSARAAAQAPTKLGLQAGAAIRVEDAILALIVRSANDVAVVVAENVSGSVEAFAERMTRTAHVLGMTRSIFTNPNGLPDPRQKTTARDMATLGRALQDRFPGYYKLFATGRFEYAGARYRSTNRLLESVQGVDGIKTGFTRLSGFNLVTSVRRDGRHLIAVVMGGQTAASRDGRMRELIATYLPRAGRGDSWRELIAGAQDVGIGVAELRKGEGDIRLWRVGAEGDAEAAIAPFPASETERIERRIAAAFAAAEHNGAVSPAE